MSERKGNEIVPSCEHARLTFGSGGFYVMCMDCPRTWVAKKIGAQRDDEFGYDIGADPRLSYGTAIRSKPTENAIGGVGERSLAESQSELEEVTRSYKRARDLAVQRGDYAEEATQTLARIAVLLNVTKADRGAMREAEMLARAALAKNPAALATPSGALGKESDNETGPSGAAGPHCLETGNDAGDGPVKADAGSGDAAPSREREPEPAPLHCLQVRTTLTAERINEAHSQMTKAACETGADHEAQGFRHRPYTQSAEEGCYICWLLEENARLRAGQPETARDPGPAYMVTGYGETDYPEVLMARNLDEVRDAYCRLVFGPPIDGGLISEHVTEANEFRAAVEKHDWDEEPIFASWQFEIGGVKVERVYARQFGGQKSLAIVRESGEKA